MKWGIHMDSFRHAKGFSLVEMLIVVFIITICAIVGSPNIMGYFPKARLSGATRVLAGDIMEARMQAVKLNQTAYLQQTSSTQYQL